MGGGQLQSSRDRELAVFEEFGPLLHPLGGLRRGFEPRKRRRRAARKGSKPGTSTLAALLQSMPPRIIRYEG